MSRSINTWGQTRVWEEACIETRRNPEERKRRLYIFKIKRNEKVLDLGCGDGLNVNLLYKSGIKKIVGVDIAPELIKNAKKLTPKAKFYISSAEKLPFKNESFNVVLVDSVFHHLMKYEKALSEIKRVLKRNGRLCFIEPHKSIIRYIYDTVCEWSISKYIPFLAKRRNSYLGEIKFMKHWLSTENLFYNLLIKFGFKKKLHRIDILSVVAIYEKTEI
jgi:demethylmenaquinone methyltransferase/2-methoxy-6-polyprenyl-1,4-benzoquinol methylase